MENQKDFSERRERNRQAVALLVTVVLAMAIGVGFVWYDKHKWQPVYQQHQRACENGSLDSCYEAAFMIFEGRGVARDEEKAVQWMGELCKKDHVVSCCVAAKILTESEDVEKNKARAVEYYRRCCRGGVKDACQKMMELQAEEF